MKSSLIFAFFSLLSIFSSLAQGDDCSNALPLTNLSNFCSGTSQYTNVGSTDSGYGAGTCWTGTALQDVWFSFVSTGTDVLISVNGATMVRPRIAVYYGVCGGTLNSVVAACSNGTAGSPNSQVYSGGLTQGVTYYVRVSTTVANQGTFQLCINNYIPPVSASADCSGAGVLCNKNPLSVSGLSGGGANNNENAGTCMYFLGATESNSIWYTWTCGTSGTLTFDITPSNQSDDIDFTVFQLNTTNPCGPRSVLRCTAASCINATASTGLNLSSTDVSEVPGCGFPNDAYVQYINMVAGTSYAILIDNATAATGFTLNWGGTGTFAGPNPIITTAPFTTCEGVPFSFDGSTSTNYNSLSWNFNNGNGTPGTATGTGPISVSYPTAGSYTAILNATSATGCTSVQSVIINVNAVVTPSFSAVGPYCNGTPVPALPTTSTNGITGSWSPAINNTATATYTFTPNLGQCATNTTMTITIQNSSIAPTFTAVDPYCIGTSVPALPTTSTNGIIGSWSPAINNTATTTYTFTPNPGQCATNTTMTITIQNSSIIPNFTTVGPFCIGTSVSALLTTSTNGITGSWSPVINSNATTNYTFTPDAGQCANTATMNIVINQLPLINGGNDIIICEGQTVTLSGGGGQIYTWDNGVTNGIPFSPTLGNLTYSLAGTDANGCTNTDQVTVTVVVGPDAEMDGNPTTGIHMLEVNFTNNSTNSNSYVWNFGNGTTVTSNNTNGVSNTYIAGTYYAVLTASNGICTATDTLLIIVTEYDDPIFNVPNIFTPNNDGSNDFFFIDAQYIASISYTIINRWGELMFKGEGINPMWNGQNTSGKLVEDGVYFVKYEILGISGASIKGQGNISVVR